MDVDTYTGTPGEAAVEIDFGDPDDARDEITEDE